MRLLGQPQPFASAIACGLSRFACLKEPPSRPFRREVRRVALYAQPHDLGTLGGAVARGLALHGFKVIQDLPRGLIVARAELATVTSWSTLAGKAVTGIAVRDLAKRPLADLSEAEAELIAAAVRRWDAAWTVELRQVERCDPPLPVTERDWAARRRA